MMEFYMNGVKLAMPYNGQKITSGYLKKETQSVGLMFKRNWQLKYCILDLTKFEFKYAKNPTETFTNLPMSQIIDVYIEDDPIKREISQTLFSLTRKDQSLEGFNI